MSPFFNFRAEVTTSGGGPCPHCGTPELDWHLAGCPNDEEFEIEIEDTDWLNPTELAKPKKKSCNCPIEVVMTGGCNCGGV